MGVYLPAIYLPVEGFHVSKTDDTSRIITLISDPRVCENYVLTFLLGLLQIKGYVAWVCGSFLGIR